MGGVTGFVNRGVATKQWRLNLRREVWVFIIGNRDAAKNQKPVFFSVARWQGLQSRQAAHQLGQRRQNGELPQIQHYPHLLQSRQAAHPPRHHRQPGARQIQLLQLTNSPNHSSSARSALFCTLSSRTSSLKHHTSQRARKGDRIVACPVPPSRAMA